MKVDIKEIQREIYIAPELLIFNQIEERLDVKTQRQQITWTDQYGNEKDIKTLTDAHASNLASWLRDRGLNKTEEIIQAELQRRCTNSYPDGFDKIIEEYKSSPETWRLKVY